MNSAAREGALGHATPIEAAQLGFGNGKDGKPKKDPEAGWHVKNDSRGNKKATYGFSVHTDVDENGFIHRQSVTLGNVHETRDKLNCFNIADQVQRKGYRNSPLSQADKERESLLLQHTSDTMGWHEIDSWSWLKMPLSMVSLRWC